MTALHIFWQADGESEKTSVRTRTSLRQLVEDGHFKGGSAPYGYDLVKSGRINKHKHKHELYELHVNEREAAVVRIINSTLLSISTLRRTLKGMMQQPAEKPGGKHSFLKTV